MPHRSLQADAIRAARCCAGLHVINSMLCVRWCYDVAVIAGGAGLSLLVAVALAVSAQIAHPLPEVGVVLGVLSIALLDYGMLAYAYAPVLWPLFLPMLRILPHFTYGKRPYTRTANNIAIAIAGVWLVLRQSELMLRWGLLDAPGPLLPSYSERVVGIECAAPPCNADLVRGSVALCVGILVLTIDAVAGHIALAAREEVLPMQQALDAIADLVVTDNWHGAKRLTCSSSALRGGMADSVLRIVDHSAMRCSRPMLPDTSLSECPQPWDLDAEPGSEADSASAMGHHVAATVVSRNTTFLDRDDFESALKHSLPVDPSHVAAVFTDIQGSSNCWEQRPNEMVVALRLHNSLIRDIIDKFGGYEVKTIGDAFMVVFSGIERAVPFGLDVQRGLYHATWPRRLMTLSQCASDPLRAMNGLRVRIGINCGPVEADYSSTAERWDFFGGTVNTAARIEGVCTPGMVTVPTRQLEGLADCDVNFVSVDVGLTPLRGLGTSHHLTALAPYDLKQRVNAVTVKTTMSPAPPDIASPAGLLSSAMRGFGKWDFRDLSPTDEAVSNIDLSGDSPATAAANPSSPKKKPMSPASLTKRPSEASWLRPQGLDVVKSASVGFLETVWEGLPSKHPDVITPVLSDLLACVAVHLGRTKGTLLSVLSNWVVLSWGVARPSVTHHEDSLRFSSLMLDLNKNGSVRIGPVSSQPVAYMGICSGWVLSGPIGSSMQPYNTVFSPCVSIASLLATEAQSMGQSCLCAIIPPGLYPASVRTLLTHVATWRQEGSEEESIHLYTVDPDMVSRLFADKLGSLRKARDCDEASRTDCGSKVSVATPRAMLFLMDDVSSHARRLMLPRAASGTPLSTMMQSRYSGMSPMGPDISPAADDVSPPISPGTAVLGPFYGV